MTTWRQDVGINAKFLVYSLGCLFSFLLGFQINLDSSNGLRHANYADSLASFCPPCPKCRENAMKEKKTTKSEKFFPPVSIRRMFTDFATVPQVDFLQKLDIGVPRDDTAEGAENVLLLYNSNQSLPTRSHKERMHYFDDAYEATENCQTVKVVLIDPYKHNNRAKSPLCLALVPQWSSPYIYKFMRLPQDDGDQDGNGKLDAKLPLRYVSRTHEDSGYSHAAVPDLHRHTMPSLNVLSQYITEYPRVKKRLKTLLNKANSDKPLIVMTCNKGQSELLVNFVCSTKARNLESNQIILFATDKETEKLCQDLGLPYCYYDPVLFGDIPKDAAEWFADGIFTKIMKAKVYCVHLILTLGYSVLFQDVDVIWYKNPLDYFETHDKKWDLVFQDDGARTPRYAPYSPNSGFYFIRHNPKTLFLFGQLLKMGDTISRYHSHQHALAQLLYEHISWTGIQVKVHKHGPGNPFPGGFEYNRRPQYMKGLLNNPNSTEDPYIFHMCWTESKVYKKKFFQQIGEWRVDEGFENESCSGIGCCLATPNITCHFRNRPSIIPCEESPPLVRTDD